MPTPARAAILSGSPAYQAESLTLFAAMTSVPTVGRKRQINALIVALKAAGVWTQLDLLYVLAAADSQAARLNWVSPATFTLNPVSAPTFTADRGYAGDGAASYLDTAWDPATNATKLTQNSAHIGSFTISNNTVIGGDFGSGTSNFLAVRARTQAGAIIRANCSATQLVGLAGQGPAVPPVYVMGNRQNDAANQILYRNGVLETSAAGASAALTTIDLNIGRVNSVFTPRQVGACHVGGALTDPQAAAVYAALHTYMIAVGADT